MAARGSRAAAGDAGDWLPLHRPDIRRRRVSYAVVCRGLNHTGVVEGQNVALCGYCFGCNGGETAVRKASIAAVLVAFGIIALVQDGTNAMVMPPAGLLPTLTIPAIETAALRRDVRVTRHVAVRHRSAVRARHVAGGHRGVAVRTRHLAIRHRGVAARKTHVAVGRRGAVAVKSTTVVRPVRPWVQQPYYGAVFDGVTLGAVIVANAVPTSRSIDVCW